jgi:CelD/BcsL family acetyltransferase involved in cellulose biosynthesis
MTPWVVERIERLEDAREHWDELAELTGHPFATWDWVSAWWDLLGRERELFSFLCRDGDGDVVGILPLYVGTNRPARIARFIGYGSLNSPLCAPEHREMAAEALSSVLGSGRARCRLLYAEKLPGRQAWGEMLDGRLIAEHPDPVIRLDGMSWDDYLASRSKKLRTKIRYEERRLARDHELSFRMTSDPARLDEDMNTLFTLHRMRWGEETTGVFEGQRAEMHRRLAAGMLARGWLRLWIEEVDGQPAAAYHGFRYAGSEWFYQSGRDPDFDRLSVGAVLLGRVIRDACEGGVLDFRMLDGAEPYKVRLADDDYLSETRLVGGGVAGRLAQGVVAAVQAAPDRTRARLTRLIR